jgi:hypothetical protein
MWRGCPSGPFPSGTVDCIAGAASSVHPSAESRVRGRRPVEEQDIRSCPWRFSGAAPDLATCSGRRRRLERRVALP